MPRPDRVGGSGLLAVLVLVLFLAASVVPPPVLAARADPPGWSARTLILPFRVFGVGDATELVCRDLLAGSLRDLGRPVVTPDTALPPPPAGNEACADPACAAELARRHGADQATYGTLSRLGDKVIARLDVVRAGEDVPFYRDQLTAATEEDLDRVMRRFAEGVAAGRPNSDRATIESVTAVEAETPARRATRSGFGMRAGFLFPTGGSFGGAGRLTALRGAYRFEMPNFQIETTSIMGFAWGEGNLDWTILDLGASRVFGTSDLAGYLGACVGVHTVTVETPVLLHPGTPYAYGGSRQQSATVPTLDLVAGILFLRTYDFQIILDVRYHLVFEDFEEAGGDGAHGIQVTVGTSR